MRPSTQASTVDELYTRHRRALIDYAAPIVGCRARAEDVAQEAFIRFSGRHHRGAILLRDPALAERRITGVFNLDDPLGALRAAAGTQNARVIEVTPYLLIVAPR